MAVYLEALHLQSLFRLRSKWSG